MYTLNFFRTKFEAIKEKYWVTGKFGDYKEHCAYGHCGVRAKDLKLNREADCLGLLFKKYGLNVVDVNDGIDKRFPQLSPKKRMFAAFDYIEQQQAVEHAREIVNKVGEGVV